MATIAIGDIHGCKKTLVRLLEKLELTPEDHVVFVGDYVDRGPDSFGVIEVLLEMEKEAKEGSGPSCTFLRGNHDQMMLDAIENQDDPEAQELWRINGGTQTLMSYQQEETVQIPESHVEFLRRTDYLFETDEFVFVHAGLKPDLTIEQNIAQFDPMVALWTRAHMRGPNTMWEKTVVCGHTPKSEPMNQERLINIDTGAVYYYIPGMGRLTAVHLPEREFTFAAYTED